MWKQLNQRVRVRLAVGLAVLVLLGGVGGPLMGMGLFGWRPVAARAVNGMAWNAYRNSNFSTASTLLDLSTALYPDLTFAYLLNADIYERHTIDLEKVRQYGLAALESDPDHVDALWYTGYAYYEFGDYKNASIFFERLRDEAPEEAYSHYWLAQTYERSGQWEQAIIAAEETLRLDASWTSVYWDLIDAHIGLEQYPQALEAITQMEEYRPNNENLLQRRGDVYAAMGDYNNAGAAYEAIIAAEPNDAYAYFQRGNLARDWERWDEAIAWYEQGYEADPTAMFSFSRHMVDLYLTQGDLDAAYNAFAASYEGDDERERLIAWNYRLADTGYADRAAGSLTALITQDPSDGYAHYTLMEVHLYYFDDPDSVISLYDSWVAEYPEHPIYIMMRGTLYDDFLYEPEQAKADYLDYIEHVPDDINAYYALAYLYEGQGQLAQALIVYDTILELAPTDSANAYCDRGRLHEQMGDFETALSDYTTALEQDDNMYCLYSQAELLAGPLNNPAAALDAYNTLVDQYADAVYVYIDRGKVYAELGQYDAAEADFRTAMERNEYSTAEPNMWLGWLYHQHRGKPLEALVYYQEAEELADYNPEYLVLRGMLYYDLRFSRELARVDFQTALELDPTFLENHPEYAAHPLWAELED